MSVNAQRDAFDREVRYALRHDLRSARALLTHGPKGFAAPGRFLSYAVRRDDPVAVTLLIDLGAPVARVLRKAPAIQKDCLSVLVQNATPALLNGTDGYYYPLWLAALGNAYHYAGENGTSLHDRYAAGCAEVLDVLEAAGADVTWAGLERAFDNEDEVAFFRSHVADQGLSQYERARMRVLNDRLARNAIQPGARS
ncbi:hypothetical protein [Burkholderia vietnamiensis]|uniref:hypothetical protein n=1 Tax=Burkholderia vietnamiensis TaxID=60552 RepID=UPI001CF54083|nr:hypothetical protein [Burkholderia vietnamiensis]MCA8148138.1 hypothetical protein [Burkholderia vietnamiensis]